MGNNQSYIEFDSGLEMNTKYLTEKVAYFLGGILAAEESVETHSSKYLVCPYRYNSKYAEPADITEHFNIVNQIATSMNGLTVAANNIRGSELDSGKNSRNTKGFSTFFKVKTAADPKLLIPSLKNALAQSSYSVRRSFIVGIFDGRGSPDIDKDNNKIRYLSLDCRSEEIGSFFTEVLNNSELQTNYNTARERKEGGKPRAHQLRIKNVDSYLTRFGLISPIKFNKLLQIYKNRYTVNIIEESGILLGLKTMCFTNRE